MKKYLIMMTAVLLVACAGKKAIKSPMEYGCYTATLISSDKGGDVWHIQDCNSDFPAGTTLDSLGNPRHNNCSDMYLLLGNDKDDGLSAEALLVDLGVPVQWCDSDETCLRHIVDELRGERPLSITFTHRHFDHTGMLPAFKGDSSIYYLLPENDFSDSAYLALFEGEHYGFIGDDCLISLGGIEVRTIEVPGHTPGSMCFDIKGCNILLTGDAIGSGHGVWLFDEESFYQYKDGVPHLLAYVREPLHGIDTTRLRIYGGHYHQKEWLENGDNFADGLPRISKDEPLGMQYLSDMEMLVDDMLEGKAQTDPFEIQRPPLDTYFTHGISQVVWNMGFYEAIPR